MQAIVTGAALLGALLALPTESEPEKWGSVFHGDDADASEWAEPTARSSTRRIGAPALAGVERGARTARFVAADRDAGQLVVMDADLLELARLSLPYALEIEQRSDGKLWAVSASALGPLGPHSLRRIDLTGVVDVEHAVGPLFDLACADGDSALLVVGRSDGQREALEVNSAGVARQLEVGTALSAVAANGGRALVASHDGWLRSYSLAPGASLTHSRHFGGVIADVAPGPVRLGFYVLDIAGSVNQRRLALVSEDLSTVWVRLVGCGALHLSVTSDRRRVWLADGAARLARRFGADGGVEISYAPLAAAGVERCAAVDDGGAVFAAPGALLRLAPDASPLPGQGGFDFLVDVAGLRAP